MKTIRTILFAALTLALATNALFAQAVDKLKYPPLNPLTIPKVEKVTLDNGIRLYLLQDKSLPVFNASVRINCGGYLDPEDKVGLAEMTGDLLRTGGTSKWTGDEIDAALEAVGGSVETGIGRTSGSASVNVLSEYADLGLEVLAEVLRRPVFDQDKIELEKVQLRSAISRRNDDPQDVGGREFNKVIYGEKSVYARHMEYNSINSVTREDLMAFHKQYLHPENIQLAVWGDFENAAMIEKVKKYFGDWAKGNIPVPPLPEVTYNFDKQVFYAEKNDVNQSNIYVGHIGGWQTAPDYPALIVMNNILGGSFASRLFSNVRSKEGLAYAVFGVYTANIKYPGVFYNFASTKSETTAKTVKELIKQIEGMQTNPPTAEEMVLGKDGYLNSFVFNFDSKGEVINRMMTYDFYNLPEDFLQKEKENVEKVTAADVVAAAKKNLRPDALRVLVVGKGSDFEMPLDQLGLGAVTPIDITIPAAEEIQTLTINDETLKKGKDLLAKGIKAHGGLANFQKIKSVSEKGTFTISTPQGDFPITFESIEVLPNQERQVMTIMGRKMYQIRNGAAGWKTDQQTMGLVPMTEEDFADGDKDDKHDIVKIFAASDKPFYQAVYDGSGDVNGTAVEYVAIVDLAGKQLCRLGFNSTTSSLVSNAFYDETPFGPGTITETMSDFKAVSGVKLPMARSQMLNGQKYANIAYTEVLINAPVPAGSFDKPTE